MPLVLVWFVLSLAFVVGCGPDTPTNELRASGHVEATDVRLAAEVGGRIVMLTINEGDRVEAGALVVKLDAREVEIAIERAKAEQRHAEAQLKLLQAGARREDVAHAQAQAQAARDDVSAFRAELGAADADLQRFDALLQSNAGSRKQRDDAATRQDVARQRVQASESRVRAADQSTGRLTSGARPQELEAARARVAAAAAQVAGVETTLDHTNLRAPIGGVVTEKLVESGEVVAPGAPLLVITDLSHAWADVFVPEPTVPRIRLGQAATVFTDAGGSGLAGTVSYVSPKAEFTPRSVQTSEERSKLVYRVRIAVDNKDSILKQGMPIEARLALR